jgi:hypothetical protein
VDHISDNHISDDRIGDAHPSQLGLLHPLPPCQVRLSEVDWDERRDGREGEAQLDLLRKTAEKGSGREAVAAKVTTH